MHLHILGICGTFMGGIAAIARNAGHTVTGCDANVYPPMSDQLRALGIELTEGWDASQIKLKPDVFVVGNVVTRGNPLMEAILERGLPYTSGPQWLADNILHPSPASGGGAGGEGKWVLAVAGTHGKTTTSAMLAWILDDARLRPGFLVGGIPQNFGMSARLTDSPFFVIEADEYDTAFFDKRSKFVHYRPRTVILNNLEYDHADIFPDLAAIETQFHHLVRTVPGNGLIVSNGTDANLDRVLERGLWTPVERFGAASTNGAGGWTMGEVDANGHFDVFFNSTLQGRVKWNLIGEHNRMNALASIAAARHAGVPAAAAIDALGRFENVKRRMEVRGAVHGITVYDDFAHHPTAITTTVEGLRAKVGRARILAVLEPRSNTMKLGVMKAALPDSLAGADLVYCYGANLGWDAAEALAPLGAKARVFDNLDKLVSQLVQDTRSGDHVLMMSNGGFGGIHAKLLDTLHHHYHEDIVLSPMHRYGGYA
jgi:UDP-N-acetylmuramate: L-alanyl-gamma-D-glutamyl-meso-diaminopimelate ligase